MKRILIIRFSSIGDIVLTTPVIRCLRNRFAQADIRFVTKNQYGQLVDPNPNLNGVFLLENGLKTLIKQVKDFKPDVVVDLHHNLRTSILKTAVGGKWYQFNKLNVEKWMRVNLKVDRLPDTHIVDRYLQSVSDLKVENDGAGLDFFFPEDFQPPKLPSECPPEYIALVIGAKFKTKQLPIHKLVEVCNGSLQAVVLIGGPEDEALAPTGNDSNNGFRFQWLWKVFPVRVCMDHKALSVGDNPRYRHDAHSSGFLQKDHLGLGKYDSGFRNVPLCG